MTNHLNVTLYWEYSSFPCNCIFGDQINFELYKISLNFNAIDGTNKKIIIFHELTSTTAIYVLAFGSFSKWNLNLSKIKLRFM